jgi:hypothetical protein
MKHPDLPTDARDARFDHAIGSRHEDAVRNISLRTRTQLDNRLRAALATPARPHWHRSAWGLAAACSLALVAAVAVQVRTPEPVAPAPVARAPPGADDGELLASLDEAPDLYLWLASDDASALVSE